MPAACRTVSDRCGNEGYRGCSKLSSSRNAKKHACASTEKQACIEKFTRYCHLAATTTAHLVVLGFRTYGRRCCYFGGWKQQSLSVGSPSVSVFEKLEPLSGALPLPPLSDSCLGIPTTIYHGCQLPTISASNSLPGMEDCRFGPHRLRRKWN